MKNKRNEFIEAKLITEGKVVSDDVVENFAMKPASAKAALFDYLKENPKLAERVPGEGALKRIGKSMKGMSITKERAKELLEAFAVIRNHQDSTDRLTLRYAYIEAVLIKSDKIGRDVIVQAFELAGAAATRTMQGYVAAAPDNTQMYGRKHHNKGKKFKAKFLNIKGGAVKASNELIAAMETIVGDHILDPTLSKMWRKERGKKEKVVRVYRR